jgi:NAD-dependent deacetylase
MKRIAVLTGAGVSAESGIRTFRDSNGLWEEHRIEDVATPEAWVRNPELVLRFYNERFARMQEARPNEAHLALARLEAGFHVDVVTQNVDDLHERGGSTRVLHLHGTLRMCRSTGSGEEVYPMPATGLRLGDLCTAGFQLRPHIVWFGEAVPAIYEAERIVAEAHMLLVIGTSLQVYPAAGLIYATQPGTPIYVVDPGSYHGGLPANVHHMQGTAAAEVPRLVEKLLLGKLP